MTNFIIENGYNTSYIDSLFMGLFYKSSALDDLMIQVPKNSKFAYLQDLIFNNVIQKVRRNASVDSSIINEIRNYSYMCGWKNSHDVTELFNIVEYFDFLMSGITEKCINIESIHNNENNQNIKTIQINYFETVVSEDTNTKNILKSILKHYVSNASYYYFIELPILIPIYINRYDKNYKPNNYMIDIHWKINFKDIHQQSQRNASWIVSSFVCLSSSNSYYTIINTGNELCLFSNEKIPSLSKIDVNDEITITKIKQEVVLIFYCLSDSIL